VPSVPVTVANAFGSRDNGSELSALGPSLEVLFISIAPTFGSH